jgi:hypothetical protein
MTNMGAQTAEAGLRPAVAQLDNRQRRYGLRLLSLPRGSQVGEVLRATEGIGKRLKSALGYAGETEGMVLLGAPEPLDANIVMKERAEAKAEAE